MKLNSVILRFCAVILVSLTSLSAQSQLISDSLNFRNPVDIPMLLSGNFGEFRNNHFHTGIDIKTNRKVGIPVYAIADGWVRRVKISPYSYGKALYVDHPTGHTSVYAHLKNYNDTISSFVTLAQEKIKRNEVDVFPNKNRLPVKKGELIGYTGNTGRSGGPHLHFEVRTKDTEKPLNPLLLGFKVKDSVSPRINGIVIEDLGDSLLRGKTINQSRYYSQANGRNYKIAKTVNVPEKFGISVHTLDYLSNSNNSCGVYSVELFVDEVSHYKMTLDSLDFSTFRYINAHKNYEIFKKEKSSFHRCFVKPNNKLDIYQTINNGVLSVTKGLHDARIVVVDAAGNTSEIEFKLKKGNSTGKGTQVDSDYFKYDQANSLSVEGCSVRMPANRLINDEVVTISTNKTSKSIYSGTYKIGDELIAVQNKYIVSIRLDSTQQRDSTKFYIARYNPKNGNYYNQGGEYKDGWIRTRVKQFGTYTIQYDDQAPKVNMTSTASGIRKNRKVYVAISDNAAGIDSYEVWINNNWIPVYYNYKSNRLEGKLEDELRLETITYKVRVSDERKNEKIVEGDL